MNKTVNINLAGIFFHIDEDAYGKLQRYLAAIKSSFEGMQGEDEIIADIEARIAELFSEKIKDERQVIGNKELDEVISVMGQPEDYRVDDDVFEDNTQGSQKQAFQAKRISQRRFFRDVDNAYLGGVSSGMAHYMGIDPLWVRIGWVALIALTWFTLGGTALIYLALWVFVPEAQSTADKLAMRGKAVNIDNITEKVKEGFGNVADTVKNVDYDKYGTQVKSGAQSFFGTLGKIILFFLKVLAKIAGVLLIIIGATVVISLLITLITGGMVDLFSSGLTDMPWFHNGTGLPAWFALLLVFFAVGIPFFFMFYLGLKILSSNLKSMPMSAKLSLLGVWLVASITLAVFTTHTALKYSDTDTAKITERTTLPITKSDTLRIEMRDSELYDIPFGRSSGYIKTSKIDGNRLDIEKDVRLIIRSTKNDSAYMQIEKRADDFTYDDAKNLASAIQFETDLEGDDTLLIDSYFTSPSQNDHGQWNDREVRVIVYLPIGSTLIADENTYSYHRNGSSYRDILDNGYEEEYLKVRNNKLVCKTCSDKRGSGRWKDTDDDGWQERSYEEGESKPDWNDVEGTKLSAFDNKVYFAIGPKTNENILNAQKQLLKEKHNIDLDFNGSTFNIDGSIKSLTITVDCNDGFNGSLTNWTTNLETHKVGFMRDYNESGKKGFMIGKL